MRACGLQVYLPNIKNRETCPDKDHQREHRSARLSLDIDQNDLRRHRRGCAVCKALGSVGCLPDQSLRPQTTDAV